MTVTRLPAPVDEFDRMRGAMERMFQDPWFRPMSWFRGEETARPRMDVYETDEAHLVEVALPGVKPDDVKVTVEGDMLTIRGSYQHPAERNESGYVLHELREGEFSRSLTLPGEIKAEGVQAKFEDGLLKVSIPRSEAQKPRQIEVRVT